MQNFLLKRNMKTMLKEQLGLEFNSATSLDTGVATSLDTGVATSLDTGVDCEGSTPGISPWRETPLNPHPEPSRTTPTQDTSGGSGRVLANTGRALPNLGKVVPYTGRAISNPAKPWPSVPTVRITESDGSTTTTHTPGGFTEVTFV